jgi:hypothetical protein
VERIPSDFFVIKAFTQDTLQVHDGRANLLHSSGRKAIPYGNIGVHPHMPLALTTFNSNKSSAQTRQRAQHRVEMAYAYGPLILALDRRILDTPLEKRLQTRTIDLVA